MGRLAPILLLMTALVMSMPAQAWSFKGCLNDVLRVFGDKPEEAPNHAGASLVRFALVPESGPGTGRNYFFRSSAPEGRPLPLAEEDFQFIKSKGVDTIVTLEAFKKHYEEEDALAEKYGIKLIRVPMEAGPFPLHLKRSFDDAVVVIGRELKEGNVLVHCKLGRDRTDLVVAGVSILNFHRDPVEVRQYVESWGFYPSGIHAYELWSLYHFFEKEFPEAGPLTAPQPGVYVPGGPNPLPDTLPISTKTN